MIVHRRALDAASERTHTPVDALEVRVAGRHLYDRISHGYVHVGAGLGSAVFDRVVQAYESVYAVPREIRPLEPMDAPAARALLGSRFIDDLVVAIERTFDLHVIQVDDVGGDCAIQVAGRRVILVGATPNWFFRNWSIAHELGHMLRGDLDAATSGQVRPASPRTLERAANAFAAELLLPRAELAAVDWVGMGERELADFVWRSGVSTRALAQRLASLKLEVAPEVRRLLEVRTVTLVRRGGILVPEPQLLHARVAEAATARFPADLIEAHRLALAAGGGDTASLDWMLRSIAAR